MGFADDIAKVAEKVRKNVDQVVGEQATKMSLIVPFLGALGYDVFDPSEVIPEYVADFATRRSGQLEKVDYAIAIDGAIVMIVEAKSREKKPEAHDGQLKKYFNSLIKTKVSFVTNGVEYRFFTDLRNENVMDEDPFFSFNILEYDPKDIENLKFFHKDNFDTTAIKHHAEEMVYMKGMTSLVGNILRSPSKEFMRFLLKELGTISPRYEIKGLINDKKIQRFEPIIKKAIQNGLLDLITRSVNQEMGQPNDSPVSNSVQAEDAEDEQDCDEGKVETTAEELAAFAKIKAIAANSLSYNLEVQYRDVVSYFGVNVGKTTWWFLRLYLSSKRKNFVTRLPIDQVKQLAPDFEVQEMSASFGDAASRVVISSIDDLDRLAPLILACYEAEAAKHQSQLAA